MNRTETRIPKVIHYIWLGTRPLDKVSIKCIQSWKKYLSDYEIKKWGDEECREVIASNRYAQQAYDAKKYAFVSDYLRVFILYQFGGVYMDTDVQVFKPIDRFLNDGAFTCYEDKDHIPTALMASCKGNKWMKALLDYYTDRDFIDEYGNMDITTNVISITNISLSMGFVPGGKEQVFSDDVHIYTKDYFCPLDTSASRNDVFTDNTYAAHLYNGSWRSPLRQSLSKIKKKLGVDVEKVFPPFILKLLYRI